jgi:hypothetical protein
VKVLTALMAALALGWYAYTHYNAPSRAPLDTEALPFEAQPPGRFKCDGRTRCSQMTSCEEATYFLENCPGTQMDGDGDGIPCERQWCS